MTSTPLMPSDMPRMSATSRDLPLHPLLQSRSIAVLVVAMILLLLELTYGSSSILLGATWLFVSAYTVLLIGPFVRRLAAQYANLHYQWNDWSILNIDDRYLLRFDWHQVVFWVVWFEKPGVAGGLDVPLKIVYPPQGLIPLQQNSLRYWFLEFVFG